MQYIENILSLNIASTGKVCYMLVHVGICTALFPGSPLHVHVRGEKTGKYHNVRYWTDNYSTLFAMLREEWRLPSSCDLPPSHACVGESLRTRLVQACNGARACVHVSCTCICIIINAPARRGRSLRRH